MKRLLLTTFVIVIAVSVKAQISRPAEMQKQNMKVISPAAQVNVRNDLGTLQMQSAQLCDSIAVLQQKIRESDKELQGANEQTKAIIMQQFSDRINKMMQMLSNMLKKMSETSSSIIGNLK